MRKISLLLLASLFWSFSVSAQSTKSIYYEKKITEQNLRTNLAVLASDDYEGRETGKEGQKKAAAYIATSFEKMGIPPLSNGSYYQTFEVYETILASRTFSVNQQKFEAGQDFFLPKNSMPVNINSNEIIFVGYGIENETINDYKGIDVSGKVVLVLSGEPKNNTGVYTINGNTVPSEWSKKNYKIEFLEKKNPALIIYIDQDYKKYASYYKHLMSSNSMALSYKQKQKTAIPCVTVGEAVADALLFQNKTNVSKARTKADKGKATKPMLLKSTLLANIEYINAKLEAENVLGYIEGSDLKDELVVVTSHYDHIGIIDGKVYNGADDNGSGTVAVLEIANAFATAKKEGNGPRRSMLFMTVSGEEKGLLGSLYYTDHPVFKLENTVANLNIDMIGRVDKKHEASNGDYVYVIGSDKLSSDLHKINENANATYTHLDLDYTYNDPADPNQFYYRSDHYNFAKNNIPIIFYFNGVHEDYHQHTDEIEKINFSALKKRTVLVYYTAWELANRDQRIRIDNKSDFKSKE